MDSRIIFPLLCAGLGVVAGLIIFLLYLVSRFGSMVDAVHFLMMRELERMDPVEAARERERMNL